MTHAGIALAFALLRTTLYTSLVAVLVGVALRTWRVTTPRVHRAAWLCVILQAWLLFPYAIQVRVQAPDVPAASRNDSSPVATRLLPAMSPLAPVGMETLPVRDASLAPLERDDAPARSVAPSPGGGIAGWAGTPLFALIWIVGILWAAVVYLFRYVRFVRMVPVGSAPARKQWSDEWDVLLKRYPSRHRVLLRITDNLGPLLCYVPFVHLVLVPRRLWEDLCRAQRMAILRHELAHLMRGDLWKSLAIRLFALPQWFNPCVWWAVRRFEEASEWAADDAARGSREEAHVSYAGALLRMTELVMEPYPGSASARGGRLSRRIERLIGSRFKEDSKMKKSTFYLLLLALTAVHGLRLELVADERPLAHQTKLRAPGERTANGSPEDDATAPAESPHDAQGALDVESPARARDPRPDRKEKSDKTLYAVVYAVADLVTGEGSPQSLSAAFDGLIREIETTVAPPSWETKQGPGAVKAFEANLSLVVVQTETVHQQLGQFLLAKRERIGDLRRAGLAPYRVEAPDVLRLEITATKPKANCPLGPGDSIRITIRTDDDQKFRFEDEQTTLSANGLEWTVRINQQGTINSEDHLLGTIRIAGRTCDEAAQVIAKALVAEGLAKALVAEGLIVDRSDGASSDARRPASQRQETDKPETDKQPAREQAPKPSGEAKQKQSKAPRVTVTLAELSSELEGERLIGPDGSLGLDRFGRLSVEGHTVDAVRQAVEKHLKLWFHDPQVNVVVFAYNSKVAYVIHKDSAGGDSVVRFPITGNETVLDALAIAKQKNVHRCKIWVGRPAMGSSEGEQILPVDVKGILHGEDTSTNHSLLPGDRVMVTPDDAPVAEQSATRRASSDAVPVPGDDVDAPAVAERVLPEDTGVPPKADQEGAIATSGVPVKRLSEMEAQLRRMADDLASEFRVLDSVGGHLKTVHRHVEDIRREYEAGRGSLDLVLAVQRLHYQARVEYLKSLVAIKQSDDALKKAECRELLAELVLNCAVDARDEALELWRNIQEKQQEHEKLNPGKQDAETQHAETQHEGTQDEGTQDEGTQDEGNQDSANQDAVKQTAEAERQSREQYFHFRDQVQDALNALNQARSAAEKLRISPKE